MTDISAIICTYNRSRYIGTAVESLARQTLDPARYEVIIVDNGSTDDTREVAQKALRALPNGKYVFEPVLGLSQARNTGLKNAAGEFIAYLDDDAVASPGWLATIVETFRTVTPMPGCVGGPVEPIWEAPCPQWLPEDFYSFLTIIDWSDAPCFLNARQFNAGANMAFPRSVLEAVGGFSTRLGRKGDSLLSKEETALRAAIEARGYRYYYHPEIHVRHVVPAGRLTPEWMFRRALWQGISEGIILRDGGETFFTASPLREGLRGLKGWLMLLPSRKKLDRETFRKLFHAYQGMGFFLGAYGLKK